MPGGGRRRPGGLGKPHLAWAKETGILPQGLDPDASISREQLACLLARYMGGEESGDVDYTDLERVDHLSSIKQVRQLGLMQGREDNTFDPKGSLARGELAAVLRRVVLLQLR